MADLIQIEDFGALELKDAATLIAAQTGPNEGANWKFYNDDHWQGGAAWTGPRLATDGKDAKTVMGEIQRQFTYANVVRELVDHHCDAVIANPPQWGSVFLQPLSAQQKDERGDAALAEQGELDELLRRWSDDSMRGLYLDRDGITRTCPILKLLQRAARMYAATGRANLRVFIPPRQRDPGGQLPAKSFEDSLARVYLELLEPGVAAIYPDRERMAPVGVTAYAVGQTEYAEYTYADAAGNTVLRQVSGGEQAAQAVPVSLPLGGRLWLFEMSDDPVLLGSILSQQQSMNKTLTMGDRNLDLAGFAERILKNTQLDGYFVPDERAPGGKRFVAYPLQFGAGTVNALQGTQITDAQGNKTQLTPDYERIEPKGTAIYDDAAQRGRGRMLDQAAQTYVEMEGDGQASGKSRETARQRFRNSIGGTKSAVTAAGLWLFNIALSIARETSSEKTKYAELRVDFKAQLDLGALSSVERAEDREQVKAGQMSRETAMTRGGAEDVDAENDRIDNEAATSLAVLLERAQIMQTLAAAGAGVGQAARVAGFDEDQIAVLERGDFTDPQPAFAPGGEN